MRVFDRNFKLVTNMLYMKSRQTKNPHLFMQDRYLIQYGFMNMNVNQVRTKKRFNIYQKP